MTCDFVASFLFPFFPKTCVCYWRKGEEGWGASSFRGRGAKIQLLLGRLSSDGGRNPYGSLVEGGEGGVRGNWWRGLGIGERGDKGRGRGFVFRTLEEWRGESDLYKWVLKRQTLVWGNSSTTDRKNKQTVQQCVVKFREIVCRVRCMPRGRLNSFFQN